MLWEHEAVGSNPTAPTTYLLLLLLLLVLPASAPELIEALELHLDHHDAVHAARADLLWRMSRRGEAAAAFEAASELAPTAAEREFLRQGPRAVRS